MGRKNKNPDYITELKIRQDRMYLPFAGYDPWNRPINFSFYKRFPWSIIIFGVICLIIGTVQLFRQHEDFQSIFFIVLEYLFGIIFVYGGIKRVKGKNNG